LSLLLSGRGRGASRCSTGCARRERGVALLSQMPVACDDLLVRPTVVIVDDHAGFRSSARALLEAEGFDVVGEAVDGVSALSVIGQLHPRVVLLDVGLPDIDGFEVAERLAEAGDPPAVVLVSTRGASAYRRRLARSPVCGFIAKSELSGNALAALVA
jgi:DNA-binding NarL/FixJ family response regulator